ncbi:MAG: response regulator [Thermodesulfobacteriota bacterium]|nr:response regulator [Thermodesulfobacteriota bacterium]
MSEKIKVLMVDDEEQFRSTTKKILNKKGFDTILAGSGEEAIDKLKENPDVVILDIKMPGMDGHQTLNEMKKLSPQIPVIMLTGHGALPSAREALVEGAFDYLAKPCDIDLLSSKIKDAYLNGKEPNQIEEKKVMEVMVPVNEYTTLNEDQTITDAIGHLKESFVSKVSTSRILETGHRSVLVVDHAKNLVGIMTIKGLLKLIMPEYLSAPKPSMADSIQYSPMFWDGMFSNVITQKAGTKLKDAMSPNPLTIDGTASLMEAAYMMVGKKARRLVVMIAGEVAGVIREQDLFFEIEKILQK